MNDALSTRSNRIKTLVFLVVCCVLTIASVLVGIDDNPPGAILAFLAAIAFVLAFSHAWRSARKFVFLFLASVLGFVLFVILSIVSDGIVQNPESSHVLKNFVESSANEALSIIMAMVFSAAFVVGLVGSVVMFIRNRRKTG